MKKNVLLRTNLFICIIIILGFLLTSLISYHSNNGIFKRDIEHISTLTSEGIFHQIDSIFTKPINISLTMANDSLLKTFLLEEEERGDDEEFIQTMRDYLFAYKDKYSYDSVFLVSTHTNRYYHFESGVDRILTKDNTENEWYYSFLQDSREYNINIDNDEVQSANNEINVFINCKIFFPDGEVAGIVGVGFAVDTMQEMFQNYEETFQLRAYLVDENGNIQISTNNTGYQKTDLFQACAYKEYKEDILSDQEDTQNFWYAADYKRGFLVTRYIPNLEWHLIIDNDTAALEAQLYRQLIIGITVIIIVVGVVLVVITSIMRSYNTQIVNLTIEKEKAHRTVFQSETEKLYENIYEIDITHNVAASEATESYFESLGVPGHLPYDKALPIIAKQQIKAEYREGYIRTFSPDHVLKAYEEGMESLRYDFMITNDGGYSYYWMRITARIFYWEDDQSVRMLLYRQNIDSEKRHELLMEEKMQLDSLSGLYNKAATQKLTHKLLLENPNQSYAFFIIDIDNFKKVNDTCGHAVGDHVITDFANKIKKQFRKQDIAGRIGGDEFAVCVPVPDSNWAEARAGMLSQTLYYEFSDNQKSCHISASIGVAISPEAGINFETLYQNADIALYQTKEKGKNGYTIYQTSDSASLS